MASSEQYRLHHSYIWLGALRSLPYVFIVVISCFGAFLEEVLGRRGLPSAFLLVLAVMVLSVFVIALVVLMRFVAYRYIHYEFGTTEFSYFSGILSKKRVHVPYQKVQSVNEKASLMQRLFGVYTVQIETAGGAQNKAITVSYLDRNATERMRNELFLHKQLIDAGWSAEAIDAHFAALAQQQTWTGAGAMTGVGQGAPVPPWVTGESAQGGFTQGGYPQTPPLDPSCQPSASLPVQPERYVSEASPTTPAPSGAGNILDQPVAFASDMRGIFGGAAVDTGAISYEYGLTNKELVLAALSGKSSWALAVVGLISAVASFLSFIFEMNIIDGQQAEQEVYAVAHSLTPQIALGLLAGFLSMLLFIWLILMVASCLTYGGFKARRRGDRIEVEHGLITHVVHGMSIERIQSVRVHQTFFQRLLGCCSVSYGRVAAATDSSENSSSTVQTHLVVHPFLSMNRVNEVVSNLTPEYGSVSQPSRRVAAVARRRALTRRVILQGFGFWMAVIVLVIWLIANAVAANTVGAEAIAWRESRNIGMLMMTGLLVLALVIAVFEAIGALLWYRHAAFGYDDRTLTLVNGGFSIDTTTVPRNKIQMAYLQTNPLQRHAKVATIVAVDAAGSGSSESLIDVSVTDAEEWLAWVQPKGFQRL